MPTPRLLDLFCGAGGSAVGYHRAGFAVTGVDLAPMPRYPFEVIQVDALTYVAEHGHEYDAIHASPPCQGYSIMAHATGRESPRLIAATRDALAATGKPYAIENVALASREMRDYLTLCGTMFGLRVRRHRLFETRPVNCALLPPCTCRHGVRSGRLVGQMLSGKVAPGRTPRTGLYTESDRREAIGVPWMTTMEARQAIPPEYTEWIGRHLLAATAAPADLADAF
jgi:DNA (cytosine-5)-methyltransferase 1